jgi:hypothetical protein
VQTTAITMHTSLKNGRNGSSSVINGNQENLAKELAKPYLSTNRIDFHWG